MSTNIRNRVTLYNGSMSRFVDGDSFDFGQFIPKPECFWCQPGRFHPKILTAARIALGLVNFTRTDDTSDAGVIDMMARSNSARQLADGPMPKDFTWNEFEQFVAVMRSYRETGYMTMDRWVFANWGYDRWCHRRCLRAA